MTALAGSGVQGEVIYALLGLGGEVIRFEGKQFVVACASLSAGEREAILKCVEPGALYVACRELAEAMLLASGSCARSAVAWEALAMLDEYVSDVSAAEHDLASCCELVEGPARLRGLLRPWSEALEAMRDALGRVAELRGGQIVDALRRRSRAVAGRGGYALRRLAARCEGVVLRQLCAWCTSGECVDPFDEFFVKVIDDNNKNNSSLSVRTCETRPELAPNLLLKEKSVELALFAGGALRVVRTADRRFQTRLSPSAESVSASVERWASLTRRSSCRRTKCERSCDAAALEVRLDRELATLIEEAEVAAASALLATVEAAGFEAATEAVAGVALMRCGSLWQRAIDLARPRLVATNATSQDDAALVVQTALSEAARDHHLFQDGVHPAVSAVSAAEDADSDDDEDFVSAANHAVRVICDPQAFEWAAPRTNAELNARYVLGGGGGGGNSCEYERGQLVLGRSSSGLRTKAPRRLTGGGGTWQIDLIFRWIVASNLQRKGVAVELVNGKNSLSVSIASRDDDGRRLRLVVSSARGEIGSEEFSGEIGDDTDVEIAIAYAQAGAGRRRFRLDAECRQGKAAVSFLADIEDLVGPSASIGVRVSDETCRPITLKRFRFRPCDAGADILSWRHSLRIEARPAWPLGDLFFDADAISAYDACFKRLVVSRIASADLDSAWFSLASRRHARLSGDPNDVAQRRRFWTLHARTSHLARAVVTWLQRDAVEPCWRHLDHHQSSKTFAHVRTLHAGFRLALKQALLVDDLAAQAALDDLVDYAARLSAFVKKHAADTEAAPESELASLERVFKLTSRHIFSLPQLRTVLQATADFSGWFVDNM